MRRASLIAVLVAGSIAMSATTAWAQLGSRRSGGSYDTWGFNDDAFAAAAALNSANSTARTTAQSFQAWSQRASQGYGTQSGIRNTMDAAAQQRNQAIYSQQQANRDWWLQTQQQQMVQQQAAQRQFDTGRYAAAPAGFEAASVTAPSAPKAAADIINWLPLLQAPQFAAERAKIEAPYRRSAQGLSSPTAEDYENMIKATEQMKLILRGMTATITAQQYLDAEAYLDKLASEARERLEKNEPKK
jgi:hypothetical protein